MRLMASIVLATTASLTSAASPDDDVSKSITPFFDVCMTGEAAFEPNALEAVKFSQLPGSFQRNFFGADDGNFLHFSDEPERYLLIYRSGRSVDVDQCAFAIEGISLKDGRNSVRDHLNWVGSADFPAKAKHIVDSDPSRQFDIRYYYLQNEDFMYNRTSGPRFLVLHISFNTAQQAD